MKLLKPSRTSMNVKSFIHWQFLITYEVRSIFHQWSVARIQSKECYFMITYTFLTFFVVLHQKNMFLSFSFFFFSYCVLKSMKSLTILTRYDTIKSCRWNFFTSKENMQKSSLKAGVHHAIFWVLEVKRSKILQKLNKRDCFCLHSWFHFAWRFSRKNWFIQ